MSRVRPTTPPSSDAFGRRAGRAYLAELLPDRQAERATRPAGSIPAARRPDSREEC